MLFRSAEYKVDLIPKVKVELIAEDNEVKTIVEAITKAANTGSIGDGKIWVSQIDSVIRIRTGEKNGDAI